MSNSTAAIRGDQETADNKRVKKENKSNDEVAVGRKPRVANARRGKVKSDSNAQRPPRRTPSQTRPTASHGDQGAADTSKP